MTKRCTLVLSLLAAIGVPIHAREVAAADSAARRSAAERSIRHGFDQAAVPVLERTAGPDSKTVTSNLVSPFCAAPCRLESSEPTTRPGTVRVRAGKWTFDLSGDGNGAFAELDGQEERARAIASDRSRPIADADLETLGRTFVVKMLGGVVALNKEDEIVPASVARKTEGGTVGRGVPAAQIVANRIVFARRIQGVTVVGGGGTVSVTFANDGSPLAFSYDWARYSPRPTPQDTLPAGDLLARVQRIAALRANLPDSSRPALVPPSDGDPTGAFPFDLTADTKLESFECGYVDSGDSLQRNPRVIQPGCSYRVVQTLRVASGGVGRSGFAGAVPAGVSFERDDQWPEAMLLNGRALSSAPEGKDAARP